MITVPETCQKRIELCSSRYWSFSRFAFVTSKTHFLFSRYEFSSATACVISQHASGMSSTKSFLDFVGQHTDEVLRMGHCISDVRNGNNVPMGPPPAPGMGMGSMGPGMGMGGYNNMGPGMGGGSNMMPPMGGPNMGGMGNMDDATYASSSSHGRRLELEERCLLCDYP